MHKRNKCYLLILPSCLQVYVDAVRMWMCLEGQKRDLKYKTKLSVKLSVKVLIYICSVFIEMQKVFKATEERTRLLMKAFK